MKLIVYASHIYCETTDEALEIVVQVYYNVIIANALEAQFGEEPLVLPSLEPAIQQKKHDGRKKRKGHAKAVFFRQNFGRKMRNGYKAGVTFRRTHSARGATNMDTMCRVIAVARGSPRPLSVQKKNCANKEEHILLLELPLHVIACCLACLLALDLCVCMCTCARACVGGGGG